jgi:outer membrane protein assembly factor BamB
MIKEHLLFLLLAVLMFTIACGNNEPSDRTESYNQSNSFENQKESSFEKASILFVDSLVAETKADGGSMFPPVHNKGNIYILGSEGHVVKFRQAVPEWIFEPAISDTSDIVPISNLVLSEIGEAFYIDSDLYIIKIGAGGELIYRNDLLIENTSENNIDSNTIGEATLSINKETLTASFDSGIIINISQSGEVLQAKYFDSSLAEGHSADGGYIALALTQNDFLSSDELVILDDKLNQIRTVTVENVRLVRNPVISGGRVYLAGTTDLGDNRFGIIECYDLEGNKVWSKQLKNMPRSLSVARDSSIYIPSYSFGLGTSLNSITALDSKGETIWNKSYKMDILSALYITDNYLTCYAKDFQSAGIYRFDRQTGQMHDYVSISDKGNFHYRPSIGPLGEIYLSRIDSLSYGYVF